MQAAPAMPKMEISRRILVALVIAPIAALFLGGAGGYALKGETVTPTSTAAAAPSSSNTVAGEQIAHDRSEAGFTSAPAGTGESAAPQRTGLLLP